MYCRNCGAILSDNALFCKECGKKNEDLTAPHGSKKSGAKLPKPILWGGVIMVAIILLIIVFSGSGNLSLDIGYNTDEISKFVSEVCENVDADYAKLVDPDTSSPAGDSCYVAEIAVKLHGRVEEEVQLRFFNEGSADRVSFVQMIITNGHSSNGFDASLAFLIGLEEALCGKSAIKKYWIDFNSVSYSALSLDHSENEIIAQYYLTDNLFVTITHRHSLSNWWSATYMIERIR